MSQDIEKARAVIADRLAALDREAVGLRKDLAAMDAALAVAANYAGGDSHPREPQVTPASIQRRKRPVNPSHEEVGDAALRVLAESTAPIPRTALYNAVVEQGFVIQGQDPEVVFSTMLWRQRERIVNLKGFGYWPADEPYLPAGYEPATND